MKPSLPSRYLFIVLIVTTLLAAATIFAGCTQPAPSSPGSSSPPLQIFPTATPSPEVTATKTDSSHIVVTFAGGADNGQILELDATVTDSQGASTNQHIGNKLATTPIGAGDSITFTGSYGGNAHIVVTAWFTDGSTKQMLDTSL